MVFFKDAFFAKNFALLIALNSIFIALAQFSNLPKLFDSHWWHCLAFRETMLFCTYFLAFCLVYYLPLERFLGRFGVIIKKAFVALVAFVSVILLLINLFLVLNFGGTLNEHLIGIALETNTNETSEFLGEYISAKFVIFSALILAALGVVFAYSDKVIYKILMGGGNRTLATSNKRESSHESSANNKRVKILWAIVATLIIALILVHCFRIRPYNERSSDVLYVAVDSAKSAADSIIGAMREYAEIDANFSAYIKNIAHTPAPHDKKIANIVLIIGESAQRNLMQIYGHYLPNTPNLTAIHAQNKGNLFVFDDVISAQVTTFESLSQVLTFANQDDLSKKWFEYLNVIDAMRLGGYKTAVISNQERFSLWSKATTTIFSRADELIWSADSVAGKRLDTMGFDEAVLPILDRVVANSSIADLASNDSSLRESEATEASVRSTDPHLQIHESKINCHDFALPNLAMTKANAESSGLFLTIHLMGSHVGYANRYPKDFERFTPQDIKDNPHINTLSNAQKSRAKADLAQYANSILYTDFVLDKIIKRFADKDSIVIYFSDHANDVWDSGIGSLRVDSKITRFMVEVPFVVYVSDEFKIRHPALYARIAKSRHKPFMIDDLIHALIDIAGFQVDGYEASRSVISDKFNANRPRLLGTKANQNYEAIKFYKIRAFTNW